MNEKKITFWFAGVAVVLLIIAVLAAPGRIKPSAFLDQGEPFFPGFTDPNTAATLEIIEYDENTGEIVPFKVTFTSNRWSIPSHHNYPADAKDRLARTAAGIIDIRKDDFRSDNTADHESCGVIDPLDETSIAASGRGKRITIKDTQDNILADLIIGNKVESGAGYYFARVPDEKRVFAVKTSAELSTKFEDWIDTDLLQVETIKINRLSLLDYSIDERSGRLNQRDELTLFTKDKIWTAQNINASKQVDSAKVQGFVQAIDNLKIVGVRPKPAGLSKNLRESSEGNAKINQQDKFSLQSKGFYFTREGDLKSNEGELIIRTDEGVIYTLRFGEVLFGSGMTVTAGVEENSEQEGVSENRYLFITTEFERSIFPEPPKAANTDFLTADDSLWTDADREQKAIHDNHEKWIKNVADGKLQSNRLNARFADWYYVISSESFDKLNLTRNDLIVNKE